jgi:omega-6 fatty acid desaturase (delta-12 desaturase)
LTAERPLNAVPAAPNARAWVSLLAPYREPASIRSLVEILITAIPFFLLWLLAWAALSVSYLTSFAIAVLASGFLVRLFAIQHDCGHGTLFRRRQINDWVGRVIGVLTLTPYDVWRRDHAVHHASSGNLEKRGIGDIVTLTVQEYLSRSFWGRFRYRLYRNPFVLFVIGPAYQFLLRNRLPLGQMGGGRLPWTSAMATNLGIALLAGFCIWFFGLVPFLLVHLPITLIAASVGVWLFYVQHQFEDTSWSGGETWDLHNAALNGSSHYDLPKILRWLTANIGVHHVHHLNSRIPYYRLPQVLRDYPELASQGRLTLLESLRCVRLTLWDESKGRLVSFREVFQCSSMRCANISP